MRAVRTIVAVVLAAIAVTGCTTAPPYADQPAPPLPTPDAPCTSSANPPDRPQRFDSRAGPANLAAALRHHSRDPTRPLATVGITRG
jgi:hypothetical protein